MASGYPPVTEIQGIDLSNYVRDPNSYNPIVYIHKKFVPNSQTLKENSKVDKSLQCGEKNHNYRTKVLNHDSDPVVEQTIRFAKDIIPLTIPPSTDSISNPVCYTIKSKKNQKHKKYEDNYERTDVTYEKERTKYASKIIREERVKPSHNFSAPDSISRSSPNNTLDDINENRSLCCSLSELSDKKNLKRDRFCNRSRHNDVHLIPSESFEALAEHLQTNEDTKIKIHLMNEKDKGLLFESIRRPVIKAIQECIQELHRTNETNSDLQHIQRNVQDNTRKLDFILEKLTSVEEKIDTWFGKGKSKEKIKVSKLEELEQDVITRETSSEEEVAQIHFAKRRKGKNSVVTLSPKQEENESEADRSNSMDHGEGISHQKTSTGMRTDRLSKMPARFCWTDATK